MVSNQTKILKATQTNRCVRCYSCMQACARLVHKSCLPEQSAVQILSRDGGQGKVVINICRGCAQPACADACEANALVPRLGGGVRFQEEKCISCRACVGACKAQVIRFNEQEQKPVVCTQCGTCTTYCPRDVLVMEEHG